VCVDARERRTAKRRWTAVRTSYSETLVTRPRVLVAGFFSSRVSGTKTRRRFDIYYAASRGFNDNNGRVSGTVRMAEIVGRRTNAEARGT